MAAPAEEMRPMCAETGTPFGRELRARRRDAGLSQEALAERSGLSVDAIAALERGRRRRPRAHTIRALADGLGLGAVARRHLMAVAEGGGSTLEALPVLLHPIVGRDRERAELLALLGGPARVVTVTGPGGVGKTRLALSVARGLVDGEGVPVHWAWLASLADPSALRATVAGVLGLRDAPRTTLTDSLRGRLADRPALLVLDNCEHVVGAVAQLVERLTAEVPSLQVLATSREVLRVPAELAYPVDPLALPDDDAAVDSVPAALRAWPATRLFLDRARDTAPELQLDEPTARAVATVCRRLDGLPLAIELAAARLGSVSVAQLAADLSASLQCVSAGSASAEDRHRTLDAAIGWSYDLLEPDEQAVMARLSAASGGWSLDAARAFAAGGAVTPDRVLDVMGRLVRKSLVARRDHDPRGRYTMLHVIRLHAASRLAESGEEAAVRRRHALYYSSLAEGAAPHLRGRDQRIWLDKLSADAANLREALRYWHDVNDTDRALRTATSLWRFSYLRGRYAQGRDWLDAALQSARDKPPINPAHLAAALVASGTLAYLQCEYDIAEERVGAGLTAYRRAGGRAEVANALNRLGSIARERSAFARADTLHTEALRLAEESGDVITVGETWNYLAFVAWLSGDHDSATRLAAEALRRLHEVETGEGTVWAHLHLGISARYRGEIDAAEVRLRESLDRSEDLGYVEGRAWSLDQFGALARARLAMDIAWDLQLESLALHARLGDRWRAASVIEGLAATAARSGRPPAAARLCGVAEALREQIGTPRPPCERADHTQTLAAVVAALGGEAVTAAARDARPEAVLQSVAEHHDIEPSLGD